MFLPLAERMVEKMVKEEKIEAEAEVSMLALWLQCYDHGNQLKWTAGFWQNPSYSTLNFNFKIQNFLWIFINSWESLIF